jgi:hypothetical protein
MNTPPPNVAQEPAGYLWPDGDWCHADELEQYRRDCGKSDDYSPLTFDALYKLEAELNDPGDYEGRQAESNYSDRP